MPMILMGLIGLVAGGLIGAAAFGGDGDTKTLPPEVVTNTQTRTKTVGGKKGRNAAVRTVTRTQTVTTPGPEPPLGEGPVGRTRTVSGTKTFRGKGFKRLGTLKVAKNSTLEWTNSGQVFSVISQTVLHVSSNKKKGSARLYQGTYPDFRVGAIGRWTLTIKPR